MATTKHQVESVEILPHATERARDRFKISYVPMEGERMIPIIIPAGSLNSMTLRNLAHNRLDPKRV